MDPLMTGLARPFNPHRDYSRSINFYFFLQIRPAFPVTSICSALHAGIQHDMLECWCPSYVAIGMLVCLLTSIHIYYDLDDGLMVLRMG